MSNENEKSVFDSGIELAGKQIVAKPKPQPNIGIDTTDEFLDDLIYAETSGNVNIGEISKFTQISNDRNRLYELLDTMADDSRVAPVLSSYAEDTTIMNDESKVVWAESADSDVAKYINYLIDVLNIDKHIYAWAFCLAKYGDVYIRLFRESDFEDPLFEEKNKKNQQLNEAVIVNAYKDSDKYVNYLEMVPNPAEMFELTRFGKSCGYIRADLTTTIKKDDITGLYQYNYSFNSSDINIYGATDFVHGCLEDNFSRSPEKVQIFNDSSLSEEDKKEYSYSVRRGQSILIPAYKAWRQLMLTENSLLINRLTRSAVTRVIQIEVGDQPKESVQRLMNQIKSKVEQKTALSINNAMSEYTNPGAIDNNIYVPTRGTIGNITVNALGGADTNIKDLADFDSFLNEFYGAMGVPKQFFCETNDSTGFNGGTALTVISSKYARKVKRMQQTLIQAITDIINILLIDKGFNNYINKFSIKMVYPTTQEDITRREDLDRKIGFTQNIMNLLSDIPDASVKLSITKSLISPYVTDSEALDVLQEEIDKLKKQENAEEEPEGGDESEFGGDTSGSGSDDFDIGGILGGGGEPSLDTGGASETSEVSTETTSSETSTSEASPAQTELPSPSSLGLDFTDSTQF